MKIEFKKIEGSKLIVDRMITTQDEDGNFKNKIKREEVENEVSLGSLKNPSSIVKFKYVIPNPERKNLFGF